MKNCIFVLILSILICSFGCGSSDCRKHNDDDNNGVCDKCFNSVFVFFDFYYVGNLANKTSDNEKHKNYFK